jgi:hypothetical protein
MTTHPWFQEAVDICALSGKKEQDEPTLKLSHRRMQRILFKEGLPLTSYWRAHQAQKALCKFFNERIRSVLKVRRAAVFYTESYLSVTFQGSNQHLYMKM